MMMGIGMPINQSNMPFMRALLVTEEKRSGAAEGSWPACSTARSDKTDAVTNVRWG